MAKKKLDRERPRIFSEILEDSDKVPRFDMPIKNKGPMMDKRYKEYLNLIKKQIGLSEEVETKEVILVKEKPKKWQGDYRLVNAGKSPGKRRGGFIQE